jgi:hypothetical protein
MTTTQSTTTAEFNKELREFTSELIARVTGQKIKSAVPANNLIYRKADKTEVVKCGLLVETEGGVTFGLFRWDIITSALDHSEGKVKPIDLGNCLMNKAARAAFATCNGSEEAWLKAIGDAITGKTCGSTPYVGKKANGALYQGTVFIVTE